MKKLLIIFASIMLGASLGNSPNKKNLVNNESIVFTNHNNYKEVIISNESTNEARLLPNPTDENKINFIFLD